MDVSLGNTFTLNLKFNYTQIEPLWFQDHGEHSRFHSDLMSSTWPHDWFLVVDLLKFSCVHFGPVASLSQGIRTLIHTYVQFRITN